MRTALRNRLLAALVLLGSGLGELKIAAFAVFLAVLVLAADMVLDPLFGKKHGKPPPHPDDKKSQPTSSGD